MTKSEHPTNCRHLLASLSDYVDGSLDPALCTELEHHMQGCEDCQVVVDTLRKTVDLYHITSTCPDTPDEVRARLLRRLNLEDFIQPKEGKS